MAGDIVDDIWRQIYQSETDTPWSQALRIVAGEEARVAILQWRRPDASIDPRSVAPDGSLSVFGVPVVVHPALGRRWEIQPT